MNISVLVFNTSRVGFCIEIFNFGLDRKIPKIPESQGSGSGFENPENPEIPGIGIGI